MRFRWTVPRGFRGFILFLFLAFIFEYAVVSSFQSLGLIDKNVLSQTFQIPSTSWSFTLDISPLFHLLPLSIVIVLACCWFYLSERVAASHRKAEIPARKPLSIRRGREAQRFRWFKRFFKKVERRSRSVAQRVKAFFYRIPGISYISRRLSVAKATVKSAIIVLIVFLSVFLLLHVTVFPKLIHDVVIGLYKSNPWFLAFVSGTGDAARGIGQVVSPIGWLGSAINNAIVASATGFRHAFDGGGIAIVEPLIKMDVVEKYVLIQNVAALVSASLSVIYAEYLSRPYRRIRVR